MHIINCKFIKPKSNQIQSNQSKLITSWPYLNKPSWNNIHEYTLMHTAYVRRISSLPGANRRTSDSQEVEQKKPTGRGREDTPVVPRNASDFTLLGTINMLVPWRVGILFVFPDIRIFETTPAVQ